MIKEQFIKLYKIFKTQIIKYEKQREIDLNKIILYK